MVKRVISRISLSTFVLATGLFFWSNINQSTTQVQIAESVQAEYPCLPGTPIWPDCYYNKDKKKKDGDGTVGN